MTCAVSNLFRLKVLTSSQQRLTIVIERDFKSKYLFRIGSVITNLVTSLEIQPIRCASMLFDFGGTQDGYVATRFNLLSSTAESSATSDYVVAPKRELVGGMG